jgi:hypothetical protein
LRRLEHTQEGNNFSKRTNSQSTTWEKRLYFVSVLILVQAANIMLCIILFLAGSVVPSIVLLCAILTYNGLLFAVTRSPPPPFSYL